MQPLAANARQEYARRLRFAMAVASLPPRKLERQAARGGVYIVPDVNDDRLQAVRAAGRDAGISPPNEMMMQA